MTRIRPFPVRVRAFAGEKPARYFDRLCEANGVAPQEAWLSLVHQVPGLGYKRDSTFAVGVITALGSISETSFDAPTRGSYVMETYGPPAGPVRGEDMPYAALCRRCTHGVEIVASTWNGPVCLRHHRWVQGDRRRRVCRDVDARWLPRHESAQRCLNGTLRARGIGYDSLAVSSARETLRRIRGEKPPRSKYDVIPLEQEMAEFPDVVKLTAHLTAPAMVQMLLDSDLTEAQRGMIIAYAAHLMLTGRDVADAIRGIQISSGNVTLAPTIPAIGPHTPCDELPDFARAILTSNDSLRIRLLLFLSTPEDLRYFGLTDRALIFDAVTDDADDD